MSDEVCDTPGPDAPRDDWREVVKALSALGESIGRATRAAVDDDENRRRLRELRDGLEALAKRIGESVEYVAASPEGQRIGAAVSEAATTITAAGERVVQEVRPEMVDAFRQASEKFKQAADAYDKPAAAPVAPAPAPASAWSAPAPSVTPVPTVAAPVPVEPGVGWVSAAAPGQLTPSLLEAVRATNDRFQAERRVAVEAVALAAASAFLPPETEPEPTAPEPAAEPAAPAPEPAAEPAASEPAAEPAAPAPQPAPEPAAEPAAPAQDDPAGASVDEDLESLIAGVAAATPEVSFDPWSEAQSDPVTEQPNAPAQPGLFEFTDEGEDETRAPRGIDFDFREVDEGPAGTGGGYTP